jgi:hypothetical protein
MMSAESLRKIIILDELPFNFVKTMDLNHFISNAT